ncbi:uncharacterized protein [Argopecten irradians]|uniref:uncharacterized protein isoform X2 n=1 Tax=Argopecten irradians TaxID=31199 RepID=UPI00370FC7B0
MATIECWQPYSGLGQLLSSSLVLTDGEEGEHVQGNVPRSTRRAIKFIRNQKLRPKPGLRRRETWLENQLSLSSGVDILYHDMKNKTKLRSQASWPPRVSTEKKRQWIGLDLLLDPNVNGSSKRPTKTSDEIVLYKRKSSDKSVCCVKQPFEPIPVYLEYPQCSTADKNKRLEDFDKSETPRESSNGEYRSRGEVSKPKTYTEILHYVDGSTSVGPIDTFEPIYIIGRKSKPSYYANNRRSRSTYTSPKPALNRSSSTQNRPGVRDTWCPREGDH